MTGLMGPIFRDRNNIQLIYQIKMSVWFLVETYHRDVIMLYDCDSCNRL